MILRNGLNFNIKRYTTFRTNKGVRVGDIVTHPHAFIEIDLSWFCGQGLGAALTLLPHQICP